MTNNITQFKYCYGCGVCSISCPQKIIKIELIDGFFRPIIIDTDKCIDCGLCLKNCGFNYNQPIQDTSFELKGYAAWSNNKDIRRICSSGGIGFEIGRQLLYQGYKVIGVRYNVVSEKAEHYISETEEQLIESIGSKYIQSFTEDAFTQINKKNKYLVIGTPCQIDSLRHYIKTKKIEENFILVDFFCHGVPSMLLWKKYLKHVKKQLRSRNIKYVFWRNKTEGWHKPFNICFDIESPKKIKHSYLDYLRRDLREHDYISSNTSGDDFYHFFFKHHCLGPQCTKDCKYKYVHSSADIRIGDLWGNTYKENEDGVSGVVVFTKKGLDVINHLNNVTIKPEAIAVVGEAQLKKSAKPSKESNMVFKLIRTNVSLKVITTLVSISEFRDRVINKIKRSVYK